MYQAIVAFETMLAGVMQVSVEPVTDQAVCHAELSLLLTDILLTSAKLADPIVRIAGYCAPFV